MTALNEGWTFEGPDYEVGIFGESVYHDACQDEDGDPFDAEETGSQLVTVGRFVEERRTWTCPACKATTTTVDAWPVEYFQEPGRIS